MINSIDTVGLRVESVIPASYKTNVNVNTQVILEFNSDLDTSSIVGNFIILLDKDRKYIPGCEISISDYEVVKGTVTYKDKSIIFTPSNQLHENARYIIYVKKKSIRDILGRAMMIDYISTFDTEGVGTLAPCNIVEPKNNSMIQSLDKILLENIGSDKYILQIAKTKTFEVTVYDNVEDSNEIEKDFELGDGLYYIRAKGVNGDFGDISVVTIKTHRNTAPTDQDFDEDFIYEPFESEEIEHIGSFPEGADVNSKTNLMYMKFKGEIKPDDIDAYESLVYGVLTDEDDSYSITEHGEVDGSLSLVYDKENDESYIFFIPESM